MSCAVEPATADDVEFVTEHVPLLDGPTPSPNALAVDGETDVSVTPTLPAVVTVNVNMIAPFGPSEPLNESAVDAVVEGADEVANGLVHAGALITAMRSRNVRSGRRGSMELFSASACLANRLAEIGAEFLPAVPSEKSVEVGLQDLLLRHRLPHTPQVSDVGH